MVQPRITLNELYHARKEKQNVRIQSFDKVLERCHRRLRTVASVGGMNTFFEVPGMVVGLPLYDLQQCTAYVIEALRKVGLLVQVLPPPNVAVLYISWEPKDVGPARPALKGPSRKTTTFSPNNTLRLF
jgi:predicted glycosyltransferase